MTNILTRTILCDDLDAALYPLQVALGIETGDVAAQHFSEYDDPNNAWRGATPMGRRDMLSDYLRCELIWAVP